MSVYDFKVAALDGGTIDLSAYKGKKILIVNTASNAAHRSMRISKNSMTSIDKLVIVGFPANDFGGQEPGTNTEIKEFCQKNYGVTFPLAAKSDVVGDNTSPLFKYLTEEAIKLGTPAPVIKWNFTKFLIDENGKLIGVYNSKVTPMSDEITSHLN
jgi:glutathione peroxidase